MKNVLLLAALMLPLPSLAQVSPFLGVGTGVLQTDDLMAGAYHVQAGLQLARIDERVSVHGEALYQQGTATASPLSCERVSQASCFGRSDEQRMLGLGAHVRIDFPEFMRGVHPYLTPVGAGVYNLRTESRETEGPSALCLPEVNGGMCTDTPPFNEFSRTTSTLSAGLTTGAGLEAELGRMRVFAEFRTHVMLATGGETGAVPLTFGLRF